MAVDLKILIADDDPTFLDLMAGAWGLTINDPLMLIRSDPLNAQQSYKNNNFSPQKSEHIGISCHI